jgi:hypothetical protein
MAGGNCYVFGLVLEFRATAVRKLHGLSIGKFWGGFSGIFRDILCGILCGIFR